MWVNYLQQFIFTLKYKVVVNNKVVNAMCRRASSLTRMPVQMLAFDSLKFCTKKDIYFGPILNVVWLKRSKP